MLYTEPVAVLFSSWIIWLQIELYVVQRCEHYDSLQDD